MNYIPLLEKTFSFFSSSFLFCFLFVCRCFVCFCWCFSLCLVVVVAAVMFAGANVVPDLCGGRNYTLVVCYYCSVNEWYKLLFSLLLFFCFLFTLIMTCRVDCAIQLHLPRVSAVTPGMLQVPSKLTHTLTPIIKCHVLLHQGVELQVTYLHMLQQHNSKHCGKRALETTNLLTGQKWSYLVVRNHLFSEWHYRQDDDDN